MKSKLMRKQQVFAWTCIVPAFLFFVFIFFIPIFTSIYGSFCNWNALNGIMKFTGLENYERALKDSLIGKTLFNTLYLTFFAVLFKTVLGFLVAYAESKARLFQKSFRLTFFMPTICSMVATAFVFRFLFQAESGTINAYLSTLGIYGPGWLQSTAWAMPTVIIYTIWKDFGYVFLIFSPVFKEYHRMLRKRQRLTGPQVLIA